MSSFNDNAAICHNDKSSSDEINSDYSSSDDEKYNESVFAGIFKSISNYFKI